MIAKPCHLCGKDLASLKRKKDSKGRYFCERCIAARKPAESKPSPLAELEVAARQNSSPAGGSIARSPRGTRRWRPVAIALGITALVMGSIAVPVVSNIWKVDADAQKLNARQLEFLDAESERLNAEMAKRPEWQRLSTHVPRLSGAGDEARKRADLLDRALAVDPWARAILDRHPELVFAVRNGDLELLGPSLTLMIATGDLSLTDNNHLMKFTAELAEIARETR